MKKALLFLILCFIIGFLVITGNHYKSEVRRGFLEFSLSDQTIPSCYIPIYKVASEEYSIPWTLLAAVHRVETLFSTMDPMVSHVGAIGHFQFMPRTWIGWAYPGTELGDINDDIDLTDLTVINEYGGYGIDATGNGKADPFNINDSAHTAAKYLADHGASNGDIEKALFAYNRSQDYVDKVNYYYEIYMNDYETKDFSFCYQ
ncbi:lytic transglycosylase domain-containing protein [Halalkalibacter krulwichiae]|uniref:Transglycosylase SLT domain protein n=1 Tax=Halalkalibacter krulwichiae TaxID=199441 RepID=A0A1X9MHZ8_9BACI|nr:lytic transglycosylase domain-containing protein [Halalkalibacter krulwichiae]ARK31231.1 Transglycosylase SLT domain protein [Halalkalibacter krulwichiae]